MRRGTKDNKVVRNIGVGRTGRCLVNEGRNVIDREPATRCAAT
jgi:hypothetical protein